MYVMIVYCVKSKKIELVNIVIEMSIFLCQKKKFIIRTNVKNLKWDIVFLTVEVIFTTLRLISNLWETDFQIYDISFFFSELISNLFT